MIEIIFQQQKFLKSLTCYIKSDIVLTAANWSLWEQPDSKPWIVLVDRPCRQRTFNLGFGRAKFWETVKFSQRISQPTPFPTTFILELFRVAYFRFVKLAHWIYFANNTLSTLNLEILVEPNFGRQSSFRRGFLSRHRFRQPSYWSFSE